MCSCAPLTLESNGGIDISGDAGNDTITFALDDDYIIGLCGNGTSGGNFTEVYITDAGNATSTGNITIEGGDGIDTSGSGATITLAVDDDYIVGLCGNCTGAGNFTETYITDAGNATSTGNITIEGGDGIETSGSGTVITIDLSDPLTAAEWNLPATSGNATWIGLTITGTAGETITIGQVLYYKSDAKWYKAKADASSTSEGIIGIATANIASSATGTILIYGFMEYASWSFTAAAPEYISAATAGAITGSKPTSAGHYVKRIGWAYDTDVLFVNPEGTLIGL
jgi:hypothetical protein